MKSGVDPRQGGWSAIAARHAQAVPDARCRAARQTKPHRCRRHHQGGHVHRTSVVLSLRCHEGHCMLGGYSMMGKATQPPTDAGRMLDARGRGPGTRGRKARGAPTEGAPCGQGVCPWAPTTTGAALSSPLSRPRPSPGRDALPCYMVYEPCMNDRGGGCV